MERCGSDGSLRKLTFALNSRKKYLFALLPGITFILLIWLEVSAPDSETYQDHTLETESLEQAVVFFDQLYASLNSLSEEILSIIAEPGFRNEELTSYLRNTDTGLLWGLTLLRNSNRWYWEGNELNLPRNVPPGSSEPVVTVTTVNNVILLLRYQSIESEEHSYSLLTAVRLQQSVDIPFLNDLEYDLTGHPDWQGNPLVLFRFFEPDPEQREFKALEVPGIGRVGTVYLGERDNDLYTAQSFHRFLRVLLITFFVLSLFVLSGYPHLTSRFSASRSYHFLRLLLLLVLWVLFYLFAFYLDVASLAADLWNLQQNRSAELMVLFLYNSIFIFLSFLTLLQLFRRLTPAKRNWPLSVFFSSALLYGFLSFCLILFFTKSVENLLLQSHIPLLYLDISPDPLSFLFYLTSFIMLTGTFGIILITGYYLTKMGDQSRVVFILFSSLSFLLAAWSSSQLFLTVRFGAQSLFFYYLLFLILLQASGIGKDRWNRLRSYSGFRKLTLTAVFASTVIYLLIFSATMQRVDRDLLQEVSRFSDEGPQSSSEILFDLLQAMEQSLNYFSGEDVENENPFLIRQFQRTASSMIEDDWRRYSFHFRLLKTDDSELASFSTSLERPVWSSFFNTYLMRSSHRGEQLRYETNRPIIWGRPANLSERYISLERGWIPIYDPFNRSRIIAWIAGEIYRERVDFQRPLRAMLTAAEDATWRQSIYLSEYTGNRLTRSALKGMYYDQPQFNRLPAQKAEAALIDSIVFITNHTESGRFREVLVNSNERQVIIASTPYPGISHHLFSYFRLQIVLIFFSLFTFTLLAAIGFTGFAPFGRNHRFRDRLVDGLVLATILFLTVLIFATQFTVGLQNERNVQRELLGNLSVAADILRERGVFSDSASLDDLLGEITTPLNADLILFRGPHQISSTTPQIFYHFLIPSIMPFHVYNQLFQMERSFYLDRKVIGNREMLIGYRLLAGPSGEPAGAIAIPTFIESPVYEEQLLSTTSTLFVMYLIIFLIFTAGTMFLSDQLTRPLRAIQSGLNKISGGDLKARVAVTGKDEIGSLAEAYNEMVQKLDETQQELMKAEREAAWKEMAQQVAHEIKNPLTPMKLSLQHLQRQLEARPDRVMELKPLIERTAAGIIEQIESLSKIAADFSSFARPVRDPFLSFSLTEMIQSLITLFDHLDTVRFVKELPEKELMIEGAEKELRRAFMNVLKNAVESLDKDDSEIRIQVKTHHNHLSVRIKDNGSGIAEGDRDKIFMPKFSTKSSGTGLGLAITRQIIEAHGGEIEFHSESGAGAEFIITLPLLTKASKS